MSLQSLLLECRAEISLELRTQKIVTHAALSDTAMAEVRAFLEQTTICIVNHPTSIEFEVDNVRFKWNSELFVPSLLSTIIGNCNLIQFIHESGRELAPWFTAALAARQRTVQLNITNVLECPSELLTALVQFPKIGKITFTGINQEVANILTLFSHAINITIYEFREEDPLPVVESLDLHTDNPNVSFKHAVDKLSPITKYLQVNFHATDFTYAVRQFENLFKVKHVQHLTACVSFEPSIAGTNLRVFTKKLVICIKMYIAVIKRLVETTRIPTVSTGVFLHCNVDIINDDYIEQLLVLENIQYVRKPSFGFTMFEFNMIGNSPAVFGVNMALQPAIQH